MGEYDYYRQQGIRLKEESNRLAQDNAEQNKRAEYQRQELKREELRQREESARVQAETQQEVAFNKIRADFEKQKRDIAFQKEKLILEKDREIARINFEDEKLRRQFDQEDKHKRLDAQSQAEIARIGGQNALELAIEQANIDVNKRIMFGPLDDADVTVRMHETIINKTAQAVADITVLVVQDILAEGKNEHEKEMQTEKFKHEKEMAAINAENKEKEMWYARYLDSQFVNKGMTLAKEKIQEMVRGVMGEKDDKAGAAR